MKSMHYTIHCLDDRTGKTGCFGFTHGRRTNKGRIFYSLTPVFGTLAELFRYCDTNNIELVRDGVIYETGTNKELEA